MIDFVCSTGEHIPHALLRIIYPTSKTFPNSHHSLMQPSAKYMMNYPWCCAGAIIYMWGPL